MATCKDCKFWEIECENDREQRNAFGFCRHSPPTTNGFPRCVASQWCGAYKSSDDSLKYIGPMRTESSKTDE